MPLQLVLIMPFKTFALVRVTITPFLLVALTLSKPFQLIGFVLFKTLAFMAFPITLLNYVPFLIWHKDTTNTQIKCSDSGTEVTQPGW